MKDFHQKFTSGHLKATEIVTGCLTKIEQNDPKIGAFLNVLSERAHLRAEALDQKRKSGKPLGKLAGIPIAVKDNLHIKGQITTCASKFLHNYRALFDATVVRLMEEEDALLIGKTNLDEFAMGSSTENSAYQQTRNPLDLNRSPGGSSGGSAAAVAAGFCPIALGSDTGGSIRQPASLCGIVGFKPTYGRVSRYGLVAFGSSLDQIGPLAKSVEDVALLMEVIGRHCPHDSTSLSIPPQNYLQKIKEPLKEVTIGVPWKFLEKLDSETKAHFQKALDALKNRGVKIQEVNLDIFDYCIAIYYILATAEASTNLARFDGIRYGARSPRARTLDEVYEFSKQEGFGPEVKKRILLGTYVLSSGYKDAYYNKAGRVRTLVIQRCKEVFKSCTVIAIPTTPSGAFNLGGNHDPLEMYLQDIYTVPANLAGLPAISLPMGQNREGMPLGFQLMGPQLGDATVLQVAHALEKALYE